MSGESSESRRTSHLRLGLIGCGRLAEAAYIPAARIARGVRLTAVADVTVGRCERVAPGVRAYDHVDGLIASGVVDAVVLATPTENHLEGALAAAKAGMPALVEKPPARNGNEAARLAALSPAIWVGFNRRFEPPLEAVRSVLPRGRWLDLVLRLAYRRQSWAPHTPHGDALQELGPHLVDLARWFTGTEVSRVRSQVVDVNRASVVLELEGGRSTLRCAANRPWRERVDVRDRGGRTIARYSRGGVIEGAAAALNTRDRLSPLVTSLARQLEAFRLAASGREAPTLATALDGAMVMGAIDAARASARSGGAWRPVAAATAGTAD